MPTPIYVTTELAVIEQKSGLALYSSDSGSYACRDEWLDTIRCQLREELGRRPSYRAHNDVDLHLACQQLLPTMHGMCKVSVRLLSTTMKAEALQIAGFIADRYAYQNPVSNYMLDTEFNEFSQTYDDVIVFLGNEWTIAAAWWYMLIERLRHDVGGVSVLAVLRNSHATDEDQWYEPDDKDDHIALWLDGVRHEPNPLVWFTALAGPITITQNNQDMEVAA